MLLTTAQRTTLAAHIRANADSGVVLALAAGGDNVIAEFYNQDTGTFYVWRSNISPAEYKDALDWTEISALTTGSARVWEWVTEGMTADIDAGQANVRAGLNNAFSLATTTKDNLVSLAKRTATLAESLLATGTGTSGNPAEMGFEGNITHKDVNLALRENP